MTTAAPTTPAASRRHDIDALRVCAFGLLILYHIAMFYVPWGWHVKSTHIAGWLEPLMLLVNQWRMPLVFMVSGLAVNFLRRRIGDGQMARQRLARLGIPLLFGMAVIIPPQAYLEALSKGATEPGYLAFLWRYFTFQAWPRDAFIGSHIGITWNHLWYLPYLLCYTLALIPLARFLDGRGTGLRRRFQALRGGWLVALPLVPLLASGLFVRPFTSGFTFDLVTDWYGHSQFFTFFFIGYLLGTDAGLWRELARLRRRALGLGLASYATLMYLLEVLPEQATGPQEFVLLAVTYFNRWIWIVALLGFAHRYLNRPFTWLSYANDAVYPWYVLHQTITIVAGFWLSKLALGPLAEPVLVVVATLGGCATLHHFAIRRSRLLRPLFGMRNLPATARTGSWREATSDA